MNIQTDKVSAINNIIIFTSSIITLIAAIYENNGIIFYISLICFLAVVIISCVYWIKYYPMLRRYKFIRYLFFEIDVNKFNLAPKMLMYFDMKKKRNFFDVKELSMWYMVEDNNGSINSTISWNLKDISNLKTNDFYYYSGIDLRLVKNNKFIISMNGQEETRDVFSGSKVDSKNGIFLYQCSIPNFLIKDKRRVDEIKLVMEMINGYTMNSEEVIYFFPWNFAKKIEEVNFKFTFPSTYYNNVSLNLFEVGKINGEKFPFNRQIDTAAKERFKNDIDNTISYEFKLKQEDINIKNLYYIILRGNGD